MTWLDKLDKKIGKYAPRRLIFVIIGLYAAGFVIDMFNPMIYVSYLSLDISMILKGQVWRIITWLMYPSSSIFLFLLTAYMYYWIGSILEQAWGSFHFDLYYISGIIMHVVIALILYLITGVSYIVTPEFLNLSMFMAYAALFPERTVLFMFIIPLKSKWLAFIDLAYFTVAIIRGFINLPFLGINTSITATYYYISEGIAAISSLIVFAIYYFSGKTSLRGSIKDKRRKNKFEKEFKVVKSKVINKNNNVLIHKCEVCGRTNLTNPELEFRYCSKCNGVHEYCSDHIYTHKHK